MQIIHRMNNVAMPKCGAPNGKVSTTGVMVTCPRCLDLQKPLDREAIMKQIKEAAARFQSRQSR